VKLDDEYLCDGLVWLANRKRAIKYTLRDTAIDARRRCGGSKIVCVTVRKRQVAVKNESSALLVDPCTAVLFAREPTQAEGDAHAYASNPDQCFIPQGNWNGFRCHTCGRWVWNCGSLCQSCSTKEAMSQLVDAKAERSVNDLLRNVRDQEVLISSLLEQNSKLYKEREEAIARADALDREGDRKSATIEKVVMDRDEAARGYDEALEREERAETKCQKLEEQNVLLQKIAAAANTFYTSMSGAEEDSLNEYTTLCEALEDWQYTLKQRA